MRRTTAFVFLAIDKPLNLLGRVATVIDVVFFHQTFDQAHLIIAIENLKVLRQLCFTPVLLQQAVSESVKGSHPKPIGRLVQNLFNPGAHFTRGLIGKGHGHD